MGGGVFVGPLPGVGGGGAKEERKREREGRREGRSNLVPRALGDSRNTKLGHDAHGSQLQMSPRREGHLIRGGRAERAHNDGDLLHVALARKEGEALQKLRNNTAGRP